MSVIITIHDREYILYHGNEDPQRSKYPHMVDRLTGRIPVGEQRPLMKEFLLQCGIDIEPWEERGPHWCIRQAIQYMESGGTAPPEKQRHSPSKKLPAAPEAQIDSQSLEAIHALVRESGAYGAESALIRDFFRRYPKNDCHEIVAAKVAMVDLAYSTHLSTHKSKISLPELAQIICSIPNIDHRISLGDPHVVEDIARCNGKINLFSFATKYCTCHNMEIYGRDDYSIFDNVVANALPRYSRGLSKSKIHRWRKSFDYVSYHKCIETILDQQDIRIPFRRRKFDHYLWYTNRKRAKKLSF